MIHRILKQHKSFECNIGEVDSSSIDINNESVHCILCKQVIDEYSGMSTMCYISTNNVLRRCASSKLTEDKDLYSDIVVKSALPLQSSIISSCGHFTHTTCIYKHVKTQHRLNTTDLYDLNKPFDEFFCPMCKFLCNFVLEYIPNDFKNERKSQKYPKSLESQMKLNFLCKSSWRYPYGTKWIPSPIYGKYEVHPHVIYHLSLTNGISNMDSYEESNGFIDELSLDTNVKSFILECDDCVSMKELDYDLDKCKCTAYSITREAILNKSLLINETCTALVDDICNHLIENWDSYRHKLSNLINISDINIINSFPIILTSSYCKSIFTSFRLFFGIQNWRNSNVGIMVDKKFWLLYNEILSVCTLRRNSLSLSNPLLIQLIRNLYYKGIEHNYSYKMDSDWINFSQKIELDQTYFDVSPHDMIYPDIDEYDDISNCPCSHTSILRLLLTNLDYSQLLSLSKSLQLNVNTSKYYYESCNMKRGSSSLKNDKEKTKLHEIYSMSSLLCPWSFDFIREFILFFLSNNTATIEDVKGHLYYFIIVGTVQILNRFMIKLVNDSYKNFIDRASKSNEKIGFTIAKRNFLHKLFSSYFIGFFESAEFPIDAMHRIEWIDFESNLSEYRRFNGYIDVDNKNIGTNHDQSFNSTGEILSKAIPIALKMRNIHDKTVESLTEPIPNNDSSIDEFLVKQIIKLNNIRKMHQLLSYGVDNNDIITAIGSIDINEHKKIKLDENTSIDNIASDIFVDTKQMNNRITNKKQSYGTIDIIKRINKLLYRNHTNNAFFETIKFHIPQSVHILDLLTDHFLGDLSQLKAFIKGRNTDLEFYSYVEYIYNRSIYDLAKNGYLNNEYVADFDVFRRILEEKLVLFLDISFWVISSIFTKDKELITKVSNSHLNDNKSRFIFLFEALGLSINPNDTWNILMTLFSDVYKKQMKFNRICNVEIDPPIISNYQYIDFSAHLYEFNWDLIRCTSNRKCHNCGLNPSNPLVCLLCGTIICSNSSCCHHMKESNISRYLPSLDRVNVSHDFSDFDHIYSDEVIAHSKICGGGQAVYVSPYYCCTFYIDEKKRCILQSIYTDNYGNGDLHGKVYGDVKLSKIRLQNITSTFCSGRLANDMNILKHTFNTFN